LQLSKLQEVTEAEDDRILDNYFLNVAPPEGSPTYELVSLFKCLFASALARLSLMNEFDAMRPDQIHPVIFTRCTEQVYAFLKHVAEVKGRANTSLILRLDSLYPDLRNWRRKGTARMKASSAALLALLARRHSDLAQARALTIPREDEADPLALFREALAYDPSALRHIELAEFYDSQGEKDEADRLLRIARRIAPRHQ
jgi:hypothetical protein